MTATGEIMTKHSGRQSRQRLRRCIVSGRHLPKEELLRFVIDPEGDLVADVAARLPGRGFWLSAQKDMLNKALEKNLFAKAARKQVRVPGRLMAEAEELLSRRCLDLVGLARRAGDVVAGFEKVRALLKSGRAGLLLAARDGASDGRMKLQALAADLPLIDLFSGAELAAALGREHVVHVALKPGRLAENLRSESARLAGFRLESRGFQD